MRRPFVALSLIALFSASAALSAQTKVIKTEGKPQPTEIDPTILVYGNELVGQWTAATQGVNWMPPRTKAYPRQRLIVALVGHGEGREALVKGASVSFKVTLASKEHTVVDLQPVLVRAGKAHGADFVNYVLTAAGVTKPEDLKDKLAMVSMGLFDLGWEVPADAPDGELRITGTCKAGGKTIGLKPAMLQVQTFDTSSKTGSFKDIKEEGEWAMTYYQNPEPARLLNAIRVAAGDQGSFAPNVMTFFVSALKASPAIGPWLVERLPDEERGTRLYGLLLLKEAGVDITPALNKNTADREPIDRITSKGSVLPDPYDLRVRLDESLAITSRMDMLWSHFIATGDSKPLRAIAGVLAWKDDWKTFLKVKEDYQKTGKGPSQMTPELLRASAYGAAGWSLGSFYRNHGLATDYIEAMKVDPSVPEVVRDELRGLIGNPAFKMEK